MQDSQHSNAKWIRYHGGGGGGREGGRGNGDF